MQPTTDHTTDHADHPVHDAGRGPSDGAADGPEHRLQAPAVPVSILVCPDGPLLVRGAVDILDAAGQPVPRRRRTVALCRCGASGLAPYCDGSHKAVGWRG